MPNRPLRLGEHRKVALYGQVGSHWRSEALIKAENLGPARAWRARTRVGSPTGTRQIEGVGQTKTQARERLAESIEDVRKLTPSVNPDATLGDYVNAWLARIDEEQRLSGGTRILYRQTAESCVLPTRGSWALRALSPANISDYLREEYAVRPGRVGTIRHVISAALDAAIQDGALLPPNPARSAIRLPRPTPEPDILSPETIAELYRRAAEFDQKPQSKIGLWDLLVVMGGTGVRTGEVLALTGGDLDLGKQPPRITVTGTIQVVPKLHRQPWPKTQSGWRTIAVPDFVADVLQARAAALGSDSLLFRTSVGTPHRPDNLRRALRGIAAAEPSLGRITPKAFRRSVATVVAEVDLKAAAGQLGHSGTRTLRHYSSTRPLADNSLLLAVLDPDIERRAEAAKAVVALAEGAGLALRGVLSSWRAPLEIRPSVEAFGDDYAPMTAEENARAEEAYRLFLAGLEVLRVEQFPQLAPTLSWSSEVDSFF